MATLTTGLSSYKTFHQVADIGTPDVDLAKETDFTIGRPATLLGVEAVDLQILDGAGKHLKVNNFSIIVHAVSAADSDTVTEKIYGGAEAGPPQLIASIVWTIGLARPIAATTTTLWADTAVVTSTHMKTITVADGGGSNRVCSVTFDLTGYRYVLGLWTATGNDPTTITALYRTF
ncbi:unnamed protein product [marine sediment metagenome]|uniref:Uncharacterized protein n=1 Tax=marine sediment metagenome TaxID=412755 RepID=X1E078_9ZZZZ